MKTLSFGHRGAAGYVAENTAESVKKAIALGADGVEIDVHCCKSGEVVVMHDNTLSRTTGVAGKIKDYTLDELRKISVAGRYKIPTLREIIEMCFGVVQLNIELKGEDTANPVSELLSLYDTGNSGDIIVSSFNWEILKKTRALNSRIPIGVLTEKNPLEVIHVAEELGAYSLHPYYKQLTKTRTETLQQSGFKVYAWTVNRESEIEKLKKWNLDAIISDFPDRIANEV